MRSVGRSAFRLRSAAMVVVVSHPVNMSLRRYVKKERERERERKEGRKEDGRRD